MDRNESWKSLQVASVAVHTAWAPVQVIAEDVPELQLFVSGSDAEVSSLRTELTEGQLLIEQPAYGISSVNVMERHWLTVYLRVPLQWKGAVDLSTTSGRLSCRGLNGSDLKLETVNGALEVDDLCFITADLNTISGHMQIASLYSETLDLRTVSGDIHLELSRCGTVRAHSVTGETTLMLLDPIESLTASSVIGSLTVEVPMEKVHVQRRAVAGRVQLWQILDDPEAPLVSMNTVSGDL